MNLFLIVEKYIVFLSGEGFFIFLESFFWFWLEIFLLEKRKENR